jgi:hypothetical protein
VRLRTVVASAVCAVLISASITHIASAHVLKTDGDIGAIMHIDPDDNPVSGTPTTYNLAFKDTQGRFNLGDCGCTVSVVQNSIKLAQSPLDAVDSLDSSNIYTFPNPGVYTLVVSGAPKSTNSFQPFTLNYLIRVLSPSGSGSVQPFPITLWIGFGLLITLLIIASYRIV